MLWGIHLLLLKELQGLNAVCLDFRCREPEASKRTFRQDSPTWSMALKIIIRYNQNHLQFQVTGEIVGARDCRLEGDGESFTVGVIKGTKLLGEALLGSSGTSGTSCSESLPGEAPAPWISGNASRSFHRKLWRDSSTTRAKLCLSMVNQPGFQMATESARIT